MEGRLLSSRYDLKGWKIMPRVEAVRHKHLLVLFEVKKM